MSALTTRRLSLVAAALLLAGCAGRPTYPKERLVESLQELLRQEGLDLPVRLVKGTVAIHLDYPGVLEQSGQDVSLGKTFDEVAPKVIGSLHRVLLSSDADVRFYILLVSDPRYPGAYLTLVRYMDDIRRLNVNKIKLEEVYARTILELDMGPEQLTLEQYVPREIALEEFLSWQLARRVQRALAEEFHPNGVADIGRCTGEFADGEFVFTLNATSGLEGPLSDTTVQQMFELSSTVIAEVLANYDFNAFSAVRLIHHETGRRFVLSQAQLQTLR
jgi:hypothetical protein